MKLLSFVFFIGLIIISSCSTSQKVYNVENCNCCNLTYTNIDSAINCISRNPQNNTTSDNRLLLFAFVNKDIKSNQSKGWNIIEDSEIIKIAKRHYLLIIIDSKNWENQKDGIHPELNNIIKSQKDELFFVITNQSLYPFAEWTLKEDKKLIIDRLEVGNGP